MPGLRLCQILLDAYRDMLRLYLRSLPAVREQVGAVLDDCRGAGGCGSELCFTERTDLVAGRHDHSERWNQQKLDETVDQVERWSGELNALEDGLLSAYFSASPLAGNDLLAHYRTVSLFQHAGKRYHFRRKRIGVRMSHGIKNVFARKTKGERVALGVTTGLSAAVSGGGAGLSLNVDLGPALDLLVELTTQAAENAAGEAIDRATADGDGDGDDGRGIEHHDAGTKAGASSQEALQKAAEHMMEIIKVEGTLKESPKATDCDSAFERLRQFFKIEHHLDKVYGYLTNAIDHVQEVGDAVIARQGVFLRIQEGAFVLARNVVGGADHSGCQEACYSPALPRPRELT